LEGKSYWQEDRHLDEYVDQFQELIRKAGYKEGTTIVLKFHRGLCHNVDVDKEVASMMFNCPKEDNAEAWYSAVRQIAHNQASNAAFWGETKASPPPKLMF